MNKAKAHPDNAAVHTLTALFSLRQDLDDPQEIDHNVRSAAEVAGTNLWVLFFAILIASVGLNVNSTAVIVGAMLISPLMGPIVGVGYGIAVQDMHLIRRALRNLLIFTVLSLLTSTVYFLFSPIEEFGAELLARTTPTLWDVLIAFFGGAAGIIALTRRSISNVVPGVAIATALMPPLCTAGYGLARGDWLHAGGAFYLFSINSVFIAFATLVFVRLMRLPRRGAVDLPTRLRTTLITALTVLAMILPSAYLGWRMVQEQRFVTVAKEQIIQATRGDRSYLLAREIDAASRRITLTIGGDEPSGDLASELRQRLDEHGFGNTQVNVRFAGTQKIDVSGLKRDLREDVFSHLVQESEALRKRNMAQEAELRRLREAIPERAQLLKEIRAQYPDTQSVAIAFGQEQQSVDAVLQDVMLVYLVHRGTLKPSEQRRLQDWLSARVSGRQVRLILTKPSGGKP